MPAINRAGTTGARFEIMYRDGFYNVSTFFALNSISKNCHKITLFKYIMEVNDPGFHSYLPNRRRQSDPENCLIWDGICPRETLTGCRNLNG